MELAVIINLSNETANDLNSRRSNGVSILGCNHQVELNNGQNLHGRIHSRVFIIHCVEAGQECSVILGDRNNPEKQHTFIVPNDKEYVIVDNF